MTVKCPICGKQVSSTKYLGQHVLKKDDKAHNGETAQEVKEKAEENFEPSGQNPKDIRENWKENNENQDSMELNEVPTADKPADEPEYVDIGKINVDGLTDEEVQLLIEAQKQGYSKIEKSDKPIEQRDVK